MNPNEEVLHDFLQDLEGSGEDAEEDIAQVLFRWLKRRPHVLARHLPGFRVAGEWRRASSVSWARAIFCRVSTRRVDNAAILYEALGQGPCRWLIRVGEDDSFQEGEAQDALTAMAATDAALTAEGWILLGHLPSKEALAHREEVRPGDDLFPPNLPDDPGPALPGLPEENPGLPIRGFRIRNTDNTGDDR